MNLARAAAAFAQAHLAAASPVYLRHIAGRRLHHVGFSAATLAQQPIVTPLQYRAEFQQWNALGLDIEGARAAAGRELQGEDAGFGNLSFGLSTGTSGHSGVFITSATDRDRYFGFFLARVIPNALLLGTRVAVLLRHGSALYRNAGRRLTFLSLTNDPNDIVLRLLAAQPDIVIGPPSALLRISETMAFINEPVRPRLLITGGEPLWPDDRARLKLRYGAPIRQVYQSCEGFIAASCARGKLHLNSDAVYVERAAIAPGRFVPVVTDIARCGVQRVIRLSMDDVMVEGACACGSALPAIAAVEGRLGDVLVVDGVLIFPSEIVAAIHAPVRYEIVQVAPSTLEVRLAPDEQEHLAGIEAALRALLEAKGAALDHVRPGALPHRPLWEKARRVQRLTDPDNAELCSRIAWP